MSRIFVAFAPLIGGEPELLPPASQAEADIFRRGSSPGGTVIFRVKAPHGKRLRHKCAGKRIGRLDEGQFGSTGRPVVFVLTGSAGVFNFLNNRATGEHRFFPLQSFWQIGPRRNWLKNNGMPWVAGEFPPDVGSNYGRPLMPHTYLGQTNDPWAPETP